MTIKATTENVTSLVATKLTGAFPVLDASAVTGIATGPHSGASDPTISTNPSGVGVVYENTTSGEMFICTSAELYLATVRVPCVDPEVEAAN